jgi:hypothetical protein
MTNGLVDREESTLLCRVAETNGALPFVPLVEMWKAFTSYCTDTTSYYKLRAIQYSQCEPDHSF